MKLIDSLGSTYDFNDAGIFNLINQEVGEGELTWLQYIYEDLDNIYYFNHSGQKTTTRLFNRFYEMQPHQLNELAKIIIARYKVKWDKIYTSLFGTSYDILNEYHRTIVRTPDLEDSSVQNSATKITTTGNVENEGSTFGFNSTTPVGTDTSSTDNERVVSGDADDNETTTVRNQTGTETIVENGSNTSPQKRLQEEIDFRKRNDFYEILFKDVDALLTLLVYE